MAMAMLVLALGAADTRPAAAAGYYQRGAEGWFWYEDPPVVEEKKDETKDTPAAAPTPPSDPSDPLVRLKEIQDAIARAEAKAVLEPTEDNLRDYLYANQWQLDQSSTFSDVWRRVVWQTPDLDYRLRRPTTNLGVHEFHDQRKASKVDAVADVAKTHGLFFFFKGSCPYCHRYAPILQAFSAKYGLDILPISLDGGALPEFPAPRVDTRIAMDLGVEVVPSVFLVDPKRRNVIPVGSGVLSMEELVDRIYVLTQTAPGEDY